MTIAIVCPTTRGGHIEHAYNLALTLKESEDEVRLITRRGARSYLDGRRLNTSFVDERLSFGIEEGRRLWRSPGWRCIRVLVETAQVWWWAAHHRNRTCLLIIEEPKFWIPRVIRGRLVLIHIIHNVVEHDLQLGGKLIARLRQRLKHYAANAGDLVIVHTTFAERALRGNLKCSVATVVAPLPACGAVERAFTAEQGPPVDGSRVVEFYACLGVLRRNKNIEFAIEACGRAGIPLLVAGEPESVEYAANLRASASRYESVHIRDEFLDPEEFSLLLLSCKALLVTYSMFDASSGVLERALAAGKPVVVADLPALREQGAGRANLYYYAPGDFNAFLVALRHASVVSDDDPGQSATSWREYCEVLFEAIKSLKVSIKGELGG